MQASLSQPIFAGGPCIQTMGRISSPASCKLLTGARVATDSHASDCRGSPGSALLCLANLNLLPALGSVSQQRDLQLENRVISEQQYLVSGCQAVNRDTLLTFRFVSSPGWFLRRMNIFIIIPFNSVKFVKGFLNVFKLETKLIPSSLKLYQQPPTQHFTKIFLIMRRKIFSCFCLS